MRTIFLLTLFISANLLGADSKTAKAAKHAPSKAAERKAPEITLPSEAVEIAPYTYRYTDNQGKKWIYRKTPFGVVRSEDRPVSAQDVQKAQDQTARLVESTTAVEDGDSVRFERVLPFGKTQWTRKKSELNEMERAVWNLLLEKRAAAEKNSTSRVATKD
ncbi:MAG: hypothetical protein DMG57_01930 [Acidobacteria bacterium]|nr:MAG: hypothetical protein DMG57_01930 [Acidobacteriota bacterium]